jgi:uncharacterized membrane protein
MRTRARLLGHSMHPYLVTLPIGTWVASVVFDIVHLATGNVIWAFIAFWNIALGVLGALIAAVPGLIDWLTLPSGTRAKQVGAVHALSMVTAVGLFVLSWGLRVHEGAAARGVGPFVVSLCALAVVFIGGWLGGELVERHGVGVHEDASLDAPSSLGKAPHVTERPPTPRPA